jgi:hypothetical protein
MYPVEPLADQKILVLSQPGLPIQGEVEAGLSRLQEREYLVGLLV